MLEAFFAILAVAVVFGGVIMWREGLTLFAPRRTGALTNSAEDFCKNRCQLVDGRCPMTGFVGRPPDCPLWKFVGEDQPTMVFGSPFGDGSERAA